MKFYETLNEEDQKIFGKMMKTQLLYKSQDMILEDGFLNPVKANAFYQEHGCNYEDLLGMKGELKPVKDWEVYWMNKEAEHMSKSGATRKRINAVLARSFNNYKQANL